MTDSQISEYVNWLKAEKQARAKRVELEKLFKQEMNDAQMSVFNSETYRVFQLKSMTRRINMDKLKKYFPSVYEEVTYIAPMSRLRIELNEG